MIWSGEDKNCVKVEYSTSEGCTGFGGPMLNHRARFTSIKKPDGSAGSVKFWIQKEPLEVLYSTDALPTEEYTISDDFEVKINMANIPLWELKNRNGGKKVRWVGCINLGKVHIYK